MKRRSVVFSAKRQNEHEEQIVERLDEPPSLFVDIKSIFQARRHVAAA